MYSIFLFVVHVVFSLYFLGLIWFVQLVHYPIFLFLDYKASENPYIFQRSRTGIVVIPPMIFELVSVALLIFLPYPNFNVVLTLLILTLLIWITTFTVQVPCHNLLKKEINKDVIARLIWTNWIRTGLWTVKAVYIFFVLWSLFEQTLVIVT